VLRAVALRQVRPVLADQADEPLGHPVHPPADVQAQKAVPSDGQCGGRGAAGGKAEQHQQCCSCGSHGLNTGQHVVQQFEQVKSDIIRDIC
jgi:hypothetical protein